VGSFVLLVSRMPYQSVQEPITLTKGFNQRKIGLTRTVAAGTRTINVLVREAGKRNVVPIEDAEVRILSESGQVLRKGKSNALGRFRAADMPVGVYLIQAAKGGYVQLATPRADLSKGDEQPEVLLQPKGIVKKPEPPKKPDVPALVAVPDVLKYSSIRAKTVVEARGLVYSVANPQAKGPVATQKPPAGAQVKKGSTVTVTLDQPATPATRSLTVTVRDADNKKVVAGATVTVKNQQQKVVASAKADAQGVAQFANLAPGPYVVEASAFAYSLVTAGRPDLTNANGQTEVRLRKGVVVK
jgi:uncharacterized protein YfaS (alpha-2-macroglobulin family)